MTQQTAVEWLENQIKNSKYFYKLMEDINSISTVAQSNIFEQAKEMEKEQMGKFANDYADQVMSGMMKRAEDYYNETYNQNPTSK